MVKGKLLLKRLADMGKKEAIESFEVLHAGGGVSQVVVAARFAPEAHERWGYREADKASVCKELCTATWRGGKG